MPYPLETASYADITRAPVSFWPEYIVELVLFKKIYVQVIIEVPGHLVLKSGKESKTLDT